VFRLLKALVLIVPLAACASDTSTMDDDMIIVSGASGQLGGITVQELLARGVAPERMILVSRTPEELGEYAQIGASTRFGDLSQPESLSAAYAGGDRLLLISLNTRGNPNPAVRTERVAFHKNAIDAAVAVGVRHIVYISYVDADNNPSPIAVDHRATEAILRESGVAWTFIRDQWYADGFVGRAARVLEAGQVMAGYQTGTAFVARADCAAAAAAALSTPGHENRIYEITGPELIGSRDLAVMVSELSGKTIEIVEAVSPDDVLTVPDMPAGTMLTDDFDELVGRPPISVRQLLEENREAWAGGR
jgi:NAD(P)H dehydrogenase (quinone)